ncbi:MAG: DNA repair protein RadC [Desulfobulbaceae bacterium]|jgi:DNA repair protein RadC|nr:DNA repair protein RadC [Desulfobulbaceae bacterium]
MKKAIKSLEFAIEKSEHYENRIPMRLWAEDDLPSEKMLMKGSGSLSDAELLSIIIGSGIPGENSLEISRNLLSRCGNSLCELWKVNVSDLQKIKGIGQKRAVKICAMFALARRRNESEVILKDKISRSNDAFEIFKALIGDLPYEEFWILLLNKANRIIKKVRISEGGVSGTVVDPKKIFEICLAHHATSIILGHNHPSGNLQPSEADTKITKKIRDCGLLLDVAVLDHIIVGDDRYYSFADEGGL